MENTEEKKELTDTGEAVAKGTSDVSHEKTAKEQKNFRLFAIGLFCTLGIIIVGTATVGIYRVYAKAATDPFTLSVANILRLPAMKVNGERILYSEFALDMKAFTNYLKSNGLLTDQVTQDNITDQVVGHLADVAIINRLARENSVKVDPKEIDDQKQQIFSELKTAEAVDSYFQQNYGWDVETYLERVVKLKLLQDKLQVVLSSDEADRKQILEHAEKVLAEIKAGKDFVAAVKEYSEDTTSASKDGKIEDIIKGETNLPELEAAVFVAKKGEIFPEVIEAPYGFHIVRIDDLRKDKVKDSAGKTTEKEVASVSHIFFNGPGLRFKVKDAYDKAVIHLYINVNNPFEKLKK